MRTPTSSLVLAVVATVGLAVATPLPAFADGTPVVSLGITPLNGASARPVMAARVIGYGPGPDFTPIYDTHALQSVTTRPVSMVRVNGENVDIRYDDEAAARAPHALPNISPGYVAAGTSLDMMLASGA